ncbi:hypothetical protein PFISCL1PPCAC_9403 [Pristionchus fissidentatus]|uniref:Uncharacterized protein n=1 Tax=Pristionchus fissidentatus TaxID=1538716 RepID=A0AAV5VEK1_9BILA|nr:hypothetical protein PFISCL1PPCAC_9403 [Pristionchus fissidentatus]
MDGDLAAEVEAISMYEDALDEQADDLGKLCEDARKRIRHHERSRTKPFLSPTPRAPPPQSPTPTTTSVGQKRSSSSENSSIEKLPAGAAGIPSFRSRQGTSASTVFRRSRQKQKSGSSNSNDVSPQEEYRMINYAFHDVSSYGIMLQMSQQMQYLSRQMYEIEATNAMQLKIITRMLQVLIESRKRTPWYSPSRWLRHLSLFPLLIIWPIIAKLLWRLWSQRRGRLALQVVRHL